MKNLFILMFSVFFGYAVYAQSTKAIQGNQNTNDLAMAPVQQSTNNEFKVTFYEPVAVSKSIKQKVYVHLMPWFETKETNQHPAYPDKWGIHYTMSNKNPDIIVDSATGRREVAMYYYPLTGPYASGDAVIIEYQLLLMKLSGIDGVFIDWPPIIETEDYPMLVKNSNEIIKLLDKVGLDFAIVYEDQDINIALKNKAISNKIEAAQKDMEYLNTNYFNRPNYIRVSERPLLLTFGPQTFQTEEEWTQIFSVLGRNYPSFFTLWYESKDAGKNATGEFAWVWKKNYEDLENFYNNNPISGMKIASAYPGFVTYYGDGGWGGPGWSIPHRGDSTFKETLQLAIDSKLDMIQLITWNDYGEGTMIEPTVEFGYSFLLVLQKALGVDFNQSHLEMIFKLYNFRKTITGSEINQKKLDQVFYYMVSLQFDKANELLKAIK